MGNAKGILLKKQYMIHNLTMGYIPQNSKNRNLARKCKFVFINALLSTAKRQKQPAYPMTDDGKSKIYYMNINGTLLSILKVKSRHF